MIEQAKHETKTQTRRAILDQASEILSSEGAQALTMRKLSQRLGASTIVLYTHFKNKQEILDQLYREGFERLRQDLEAVPPGGDPVAQVMELGRAYRRSALANRTYYQIMFSACVPGFEPSEESLRKSQQSFAVLYGAVQHCLEAGSLAKGDPAQITKMLWGAVHGIISLELFGHLGPVAAGPSKEGTALLELTLATIRDGLLARS